MGQPPYGPYDPYQPPAHPPAVQHHYYGAPAPPTNGMATASMVLGLCGFVTCGLTSILAVIFGHVAQSQIKRTGEGGQGMAVAGLILGYLVTAGWLIYLAFWLIWGFALLGGALSTTSTY